MKLPRDLSGRQVVQTPCRDWAYRVVHQQGSHIVLETDKPGHQRLAVPDHNISPDRHTEQHPPRGLAAQGHRPRHAAPYPPISARTSIGSDLEL